MLICLSLPSVVMIKHSNKNQAKEVRVFGLHSQVTVFHWWELRYTQDKHPSSPTHFSPRHRSDSMLKGS